MTSNNKSHPTASTERTRTKAPPRPNEATRQLNALTLLPAEVHKRLDLLEVALRNHEPEAMYDHAVAIFRSVNDKLQTLTGSGDTYNQTKQMYGFTMIDCKIIMAYAFSYMGRYTDSLGCSESVLEDMMKAQKQTRYLSLRDKMIRLAIVRAVLGMQTNALPQQHPRFRSIERDWKPLKRYNENRDADILFVRAQHALMSAKTRSELEKACGLGEQVFEWWRKSMLPAITEYVVTAERQNIITSEDNGKFVQTVTWHQAQQRTSKKSPIVCVDLPPGLYRFILAAKTADGKTCCKSEPTQQPLLISNPAVSNFNEHVKDDTNPVTKDANPVAKDANPVAKDANPVAKDANPVVSDANPVVSPVANNGTQAHNTETSRQDDQSTTYEETFEVLQVLNVVQDDNETTTPNDTGTINDTSKISTLPSRIEQPVVSPATVSMFDTFTFDAPRWRGVPKLIQRVLGDDPTVKSSVVSLDFDPPETYRPFTNLSDPILNPVSTSLIDRIVLRFLMSAIFDPAELACWLHAVYAKLDWHHKEWNILQLVQPHVDKAHRRSKDIADLVSQGNPLLQAIEAKDI